MKGEIFIANKACGRDPDKKLRTENAVRVYKDMVYGIAVTQLRNRHDADDAFQEVFMTYLAKAPEFDNDGHEKAWLIRTTLNICKRFSFAPKNFSLDEIFGGGEEETLKFRTEEETKLFAELKALPEKYRLPLYFYYFEGMPSAECAKILKLSEAALRKRLSRGRGILRKRLECDYFE